MQLVGAHGGDRRAGRVADPIDSLQFGVAELVLVAGQADCQLDPAGSGQRQLPGGTWITDFTDPASPVTVAWSDPPPLVPTQLGGAWSSYWYNNFAFESEITKGSERVPGQ